MRRRAVAFALACAAGAAASMALRPRVRAAERFVPIDLERQIPAQFGDWRVDRGIVPVLPDPAVQAKLDAIYTQVLARTFVNARGTRVMLSIAYGADQGSDATAVHRPEFCYSAQGFSVRALGEDRLLLGGRRIDVRRLVGRLSGRIEPITYWVTLNDHTVLPGVERKLEQIRLGLQGLIPDGMLIRVSSIDPDPKRAFAAQDAFLADLEHHIDPQVRSRFFGVEAG